MSDPSMVGFVIGAGRLLFILPPAGAYFLVKGIIGIVNITNEKSQQPKQLLMYNTITCATLKSSAISLPPSAR
jgi:hypothetical protein